MCGIVAVAGKEVQIIPAIMAQAHRGPDGDGYWRDDGCALGMMGVKA